MRLKIAFTNASVILVLTVGVILGDPGFEVVLVEGLTQCVEDGHELATLHEARLALVEHGKYLPHGCSGVRAGVENHIRNRKQWSKRWSEFDIERN